MAKIRVRAKMTIETGTPAKPVTVPFGSVFDMDDGDPENLLGRGIVEEIVDDDVVKVPASTGAAPLA